MENECLHILSVLQHNGDLCKSKIKYTNTKCAVSTLMTTLVSKLEINVKFYWYLLSSNLNYLANNLNKGAANKTLDIERFKQMLIPVPPLEIQKMLVERCDKLQTQIEKIQELQQTSQKSIDAVHDVIATLLQNIQSIPKPDDKSDDTLDKLPDIEKLSISEDNGSSSDTTSPHNWIVYANDDEIKANPGLYIINGKSTPSIKEFIKRAQIGDRVWFMLAKSQGKIIGIATFIQCNAFESKIEIIYKNIVYVDNIKISTRSQAAIHQYKGEMNLSVLFNTLMNPLINNIIANYIEQNNIDITNYVDNMQQQSPFTVPVQVGPEQYWQLIPRYYKQGEYILFVHENVTAEIQEYINTYCKQAIESMYGCKVYNIFI